jgi:hypothetical protein
MNQSSFIGRSCVRRIELISLRHRVFHHCFGDVDFLWNQTKLKKRVCYALLIRKYRCVDRVKSPRLTPRNYLQNLWINPHIPRKIGGYLGRLFFCPGCRAVDGSCQRLNDFSVGLGELPVAKKNSRFATRPSPSVKTLASVAA